MESDETLNLENLDESIYEAFKKAYSNVEERDICHTSRNFAQVVRGLIEIGSKSDLDVDVGYKEVANTLAYWCIRNSSLEKLVEGKRNEALGDAGAATMTDEEMDSLISEISARLADWLLGFDVLRQNPELLESFIRGAVVAEELTSKNDEGKPKT